MKDGIFKYQFHTPQAGRNFQHVVSLLRRVIEENALKIEVTEVPYKELSDARDRISSLESERDAYLETLKKIDASCDCEGMPSDRHCWALARRARDELIRFRRARNR